REHARPRARRGRSRERLRADRRPGAPRARRDERGDRARRGGLALLGRERAATEGEPRQRSGPALRAARRARGRGGRVSARRLGTFLLVGAALSLAVPALAHPVRIGRYAAIPYGIDPAHPFPTAGGGPRRNGRTRGTAPASEPVQLWERTLRHRRPRGPAIAKDGTLYVGTMGGLTALDPDGTERWTVRLGAVHAMPSLAP